MQAAQKVEEQRRKRREVQGWNARICSSHAVQRTLVGMSGTTAAGSRADKKQQQGEAAGYFLRTGPSGGPDVWREPTHRELLDRLGRRSNAYRRKTLLAVEKAMFSSVVVLRRTKITLMMIL